MLLILLSRRKFLELVKQIYTKFIYFNLSILRVNVISLVVKIKDNLT